jgi:hypothetical protein
MAIPARQSCTANYFRHDHIWQGQLSVVAMDSEAVALLSGCWDLCSGRRVSLRKLAAIPGSEHKP